MKVLVLGITGLIGRSIFDYLATNNSLEVFGTNRLTLNSESKSNLRFYNHYLDISPLEKYILEINPDFIINCIGLTKHIRQSRKPLHSIAINSLFPHQVIEVCRKVDAKLIQISTDCVFYGDKGEYSELDTPDAKDLYGRSKALGEIDNLHDITIRTSTIGHEETTKYGLLEWFLSQEESCLGYRKAIFSGLTTQELSKVIDRYILTDKGLHGIFHIGGNPISKFDLLNIISNVYSKNIEIKPEMKFEIDRSLNSSKFQELTGYKPPTWEKMIINMHSSNLGK